MSEQATARANDNDVVLEVSDLSVSIGTTHGTVHAVDRVSFRVRRGEVLAVLGESGCGKSTTARAIAGLACGRFDHVDGSIRLGGVELAGMSRAERRPFSGTGISMVFQDALAALNPVQKVGTQIVESLQLSGATRRRARKRACELLAEVGIPDPNRRVHAYPHELSGGMRQRVMIALALARDPKVLIADEPTSALDVSVQAKVLELFVELQNELNFAALFISHDLAVVDMLSDRIGVLFHGDLLEEGTGEQVLGDPQHDYTKRLIASLPVPDPVEQATRRELARSLR